MLAHIRHDLASLLLTLAFLVIVAPAAFTGGANLTREAETLLQFKQELTHAQERLSGWSVANLAGFCHTWQGVICSTLNATVIGLDFTAFNVGGSLTTPLCAQLPNLAELHFSSNSFRQHFPGFLIQLCKELTVIDFSMNEFYGQLPANVSTNLSKLKVFNMEGNNFEGSIPADLGNLLQLRTLRLGGNSLSSRIPPQLGQLSLLQVLDLSFNPYDAQEIPHALSNLSSLQELSLAGCRLIGKIPDFLGNFSDLWFLSLSINNLSGIIPTYSLVNLHNLTELSLYGNHLSGSVPPFNFIDNPHLTVLQLHYNSLSGTIPNTLTSLPNLAYFFVSRNNLTGTLSSEWGLHSTLEQFDVTDNYFIGAIPRHICKGNAGAPLSLFLSGNYLNKIPAEFNDCKRMVNFVANSNWLSGSVPSGLWTLPILQVLNLQNNYLSGKIIIRNPQSSAWQGSLQRILLDSNGFEGTIPSEVDQYWFNLSVLTAAENRLSGPLPPEIGIFSNLETLDLSMNFITGEIPPSIGNCISLISLSLKQNDLSGPIPAQLGQIPKLKYLDLSLNRLNGSIPSTMAKSTYSLFNVSDNNLSGRVPRPLMLGNGSFGGNPELCLSQPCTNSFKTGNSHGGKIGIRVLIPACALTLVFIASMVMVCRKARDKSGKRDNSRLAKDVGNDWTVVYFQKLGLNAMELYESLHEKNVIGWGSSGKVYKVWLESGGEAVAVKKLNATPSTMNCRVSKSAKESTSSHEGYVNKQDESSAFQSEVEILGCNLKHRNIVTLMCSCESKEAKLLVYEYLCNGSLGDVLHKAFRSELSCWTTRFGIALGAAEGLAYLHHDCVPPILHRDIKPNNILLDSVFQAKLADFGVAKSFQGRCPMSSVVGSVGYIAPEYAYTSKVDEKSDVYSYGVVLLELVTGRSPTSKELESEGVELVKWVTGKLKAECKEGLWKLVFDSRLVNVNFGASDKQSMLSVLKVALLCTCVSPRRRPSMRAVVELLCRATPIAPPHNDG